MTDCGSLDDPDNGQVELSSTVFGSTANYSCNLGYSLSNGNNTRTCEADGEWSGDPPSCECMRLVFLHAHKCSGLARKVSKDFWKTPFCEGTHTINDYSYCIIQGFVTMLLLLTFTKCQRLGPMSCHSSKMVIMFRWCR